MAAPLSNSFNAGSPARASTPAIVILTWLNSVGSSVIWTGAYFVAEKELGFDESRNLLLAIASALVYIPAAILSGRLTRVLGRRISSRGVLAAVLVAQAIAVLPAALGGWGVVVAAIAGSACAALLWPLVESFATSGRHGHELRRAVTTFNLSWMSAVGVALLAIGPVVASDHPEWSIAAFAPLSLASIVALRWFPAHPQHVDLPSHAGHLPPNYPALLAASRTLLPGGYMVIGALGPLFPFLVDSVGIDPSWETGFVATWMWARVAGAAILARTHVWHGRWSALWLGTGLVLGGFALVLAAPNAATMVVALIAFGLGQSILYSASLYYAMAVGGAQVEAGGTFEALIGVGYVAGPLAALLGAQSGEQRWIVAAVWAMVACAVVPAIRQWRQSVRAAGRTPPAQAG